jgi:hypothetical protein
VQALVTNLLAPLDWEVSSVAALQEKLRAWAETPMSSKAGWVIGFGYDDSQLRLHDGAGGPRDAGHRRGVGTARGTR